MKNFICVALALICAICVISCDHKSTDTPSSTTTQTDETNDVSATAETTDNRQISDPHKVTKLEWETALNFNEISPTRAAQHVWYPKTEDHDEHFIYYDVIEYTDDVIRIYDMDETMSHIEGERYYVKQGDTYTYYYLSGTGDKESTIHWTSAPSSQSSFWNCYDRLIGSDDKYGIAELFLYDNFTYDTAKGIYTCEQIDVVIDDEVFSYYNVELKFNDGKLEYYYMEGEGDGYNCVKTILSYDPVKIVLPFTLP